MNALWILPAVVLAVGLGVAWYLLRDAAAAARDLREGIVRFGEVRVALRRLQDDSGELRRGLDRYRRHREGHK